jgi:tetratricopeptide (TPR) repeat protein
MPRHLIEYVLKGVLLGLLVCAGLAAPERTTDWHILLWPTVGLVLGVLAGAGRRFAQGFRPGGHPFAFYHIVILENPGPIYAGTILGAAVAASLAAAHDDRHLLPTCVVGGAILGVGMALLRGVRRKKIRETVGLVGAAVIVAAVVGPAWYNPSLLSADRQWDLFASLMCGVIFFAALVFVGEAEQSEADAAVFCAGVALVFWFMRPHFGIPAFAVALPFALYFLQVRWSIPRRRLSREIIRGQSYACFGLYGQALAALRRATQLDPSSEPARKALWHIHCDLDATRLAADPELVKLVDPQLCLDRVATLLLAERPSEAQRAESTHLLDLIAGQSSALLPQVTYWRAVAHTHAGQLEQAAEQLTRLLDPTAWPAGDPSRQAVILPAWQLALTLHPELNRRVGSVEIAMPGRRMEAIGAVEQGLAAAPKDAEAWKLKRLLYHDVTEAEYNAGPVTAFDHAFVQQLGLALIGDPSRFTRGAEYLRIAARGLPQEAPSIYTQVAAAFEQARDADEARRTLRLGKAAGLGVGPQALPEAERHAFFGLVHRLAEDAHARGDYSAAIEDYQLYTQYERAGIETYRILADLYEKLADALSALRTIEQALTYNAKDPDLLARRDRYYYSVMPNQLRAAPEQFRQAIDVRYCLAKARQVVEHRESDYEALDWAVHLIELAEVVQPGGTAARAMLARAELRRGERDEAVATLESVRTPKPEKFATTDDEDAWFLANKLLGDLYLRELDRPDLAVECFTAFRSSAKSGADTLYKLGEAYERLGDVKRAAKFYEQVTAFDGHPMAPEARAALWRVRETSTSE